MCEVCRHRFRGCYFRLAVCHAVPCFPPEITMPVSASAVGGESVRPLRLMTIHIVLYVTQVDLNIFNHIVVFSGC